VASALNGVEALFAFFNEPLMKLRILVLCHLVTRNAFWVKHSCGATTDM